jgi:hypothetical protein
MKFQFDKDQYHRQNEMELWCRENIGYGKWTYGDIDNWKGMEGARWVIWSMFGSTFFKFRYQKDAVLFALKWE